MKEYFESGWNCLEISAYISCLISVFVTLLDDRSSWISLNSAGEEMYDNVVGAFALLLVWGAMFSHLRGFLSYHRHINTFTQILLDMRGFIGVVVVLWLGGAMAFKVLLPGQPDFLNANALSTVFLMIMGDPMMDALEVESNETVHGVISPMHAMVTSAFAKILALSFVFVVVIVLMNQLIALMGGSYEAAEELIDIESKRARSQTILELLELYAWALNTDQPTKPNHVYPKWLHVLRPKKGGMKSKLTKKNNLTQQLFDYQKGSDKMFNEQAQLKHDTMKEKFSEMEEKLATMDGKQAAMDEKVDKVLKLLVQLNAQRK